MNKQYIVLVFYLICLTFSCKKNDEVLNIIETTNLNQDINLENNHLNFEITLDDANIIIKDFISNSELRSSLKNDLEIDFISEFSTLKEFRSLSSTDIRLNKAFYLAQFKGNNGYALISKDKRTFPIFAVIDKGRFSFEHTTNKKEKLPIKALLNGYELEIKLFDNGIDKISKANKKLRSKKNETSINSENAINEFLENGWRETRRTDIRLKVNDSEIYWGQKIINNNFLNKNGMLFTEAYPFEAYFDWWDFMNDEEDELLRSSKSRTTVFGCTTIAYGATLYALKDFPGFQDLTYTNGEQILWDRMNPNNSENTETQRFLGWLTENFNPTYLNAGTLIFNTDAKAFIRKILGGSIISRYDNCVPPEDWDGYGRSEDKRVAEEFFQYPNCFVIMTASSETMNFWNYHTFVIDGMIEFKKRIKDSGWFGWGLFSKWRNATRHLYHINAGWNGYCNGYYLYVQDVDDKFGYTGKNSEIDYRSKPSYFIFRPK